VPVVTTPRYNYLIRPEQRVAHDPLVGEHECGRGRMITTLTYFMMQSVFRTPLKITQYIYDDVIYETLPFKVEGPPVQYLFNRLNGGWLVSIFNNGYEKWKGEVVSTRKASLTRFDWGKPDSIRWSKKGGKWRLGVSVPRFSFKIIKVHPQKGRGEKRQQAV